MLGRTRRRVPSGVTYVAAEEAAPRTVLGYFTIAMSSVPREMFPKKYVRGLPNYDLPLILLARLAVDHRFAGKGIGHALISEAFRISLRVSDEVGCRCVMTDAYRQRMNWYARYGFVPSREARPKALNECFLISERFGRHSRFRSRLAGRRGWSRMRATLLQCSDACKLGSSRTCRNACKISLWYWPSR